MRRPLDGNPPLFNHITRRSADYRQSFSFRRHNRQIRLPPKPHIAAVGQMLVRLRICICRIWRIIDRPGFRRQSHYSRKRNHPRRQRPVAASAAICHFRYRLNGVKPRQAPHRLIHRLRHPQPQPIGFTRIPHHIPAAAT